MKDSTPIGLAQGQLEAYNRRDVEAFLKFYSPTVQVFDFPSPSPRITGIEEFRASYAKLFKENPALHCELVNRLSHNSTVIDQERIMGLVGQQPMGAIVIYEIEDGLISKVRVIK
jgi:hypothetical protein